MHSNSMLHLIILIILLNVAHLQDATCPAKCTCKKLQRSGDDGNNGKKELMKIRCGDELTKINNLDELNLTGVADEIVHLNLSNNLLPTFHLLGSFTFLQKLDLSRNHLTSLTNDQFASFPNLRRLDLAANNIKSIALQSFTNLSSLERLKLSQNQINTIELGTFDSLPNLKQLDISGNPLTCDCGLLWLLDFTQKQSIKLTANPTCDSPPSFKSLLLRKIKIGVDIKCESPALNNAANIVHMQPQHNQVVFEGDKLQLSCSAPSIVHSYDPNGEQHSRIEWTYLDSEAKDYFSDIQIETHFLQSTGFLSSTLRFVKLNRNHTGIWNCQLISRQGNHSKGITIVVISEDTKYCPLVTTRGNKGSYTWPRTVVNYTASIPCESVNLNFDLSTQKASYFCGINGEWSNLDTETCSYILDTTRYLEQFSKVNNSIMESAKHFRNYTSDMSHFQDVMDIVFATRTMQNYIKYLNINQIGSILIDVINNLLQLPKSYVDLASDQFAINEDLVDIAEELARMSATSLLHKSNIATEIFQLKSRGFSGLKCTWYVDLKISTERLFKCVTNSHGEVAGEMYGKSVEASVTIPETMFEQLIEQGYELSDEIYEMQIAMQTNSKLFPMAKAERKRWDVKSAVVGAKLLGFQMVNLTDPIYVMLKAGDLTAPIPVWWNPAIRNWTTDGCHFSHEYHNNIVFFCHNFGYYGLLQDISELENVKIGAKFKLSHPAIYVGSFILFTSLLVAIMTYLLCYPQIQMPKKAKHTLINLWISICFLCFLYVFGIYQTETLKLCQIIGMLLHYFTLSSMLWICVGVNCMYKRLSRSSGPANIMELQDDELHAANEDVYDDIPVKKPILGLYFVGWGIAIIVCGISAAINIRDYASSNYCFLRVGPPLSALYIPFSILLIFLLIFFLLIRCAIYSTDSNGHLSEGTQATENVDLDLLEPNFPSSANTNENRSILTETSSKTALSELEDSEHLPSAQLKAYIIFLVIYLSAWMSCALATIEPKEQMWFWFESDLFSILYALLATILSAFTLFFYCIARNDVRTQWMVLSRWLKKRKFCFRSRNVRDTTLQPVQPLPVPLVVGEQVLSRSSSRSSTRTKSNKTNSELNGHTAAASSSEGGTKINNVNLVVLHRQQYRSNLIPNLIENTGAQVFYNPHQSIVARKFFKRQKRHQMKRNNLVGAAAGCSRNDSDSTSVVSERNPKKKKNFAVMIKEEDEEEDGGIKEGVEEKMDHQMKMFGTNSKVNNTNIHVENNYLNKVKRRKREKNPNLFSDSGDEDEELAAAAVSMPMHSIADQLMVRNLRKMKNRKKRDNVNLINENDLIDNGAAATMRSVSQQCTLEYSSENISDSILEKTASPEKKSQSSLLIDAECFQLDKSEGEEDGKLFGRIYVNPLQKDRIHRKSKSFEEEKGGKDLAGGGESSVSISDLDELYQQIRRGPPLNDVRTSDDRTKNNDKVGLSSVLNNSALSGVSSTANSSNHFLTRNFNSPCYSDSDILQASERRNDCRNSLSNLSDSNVETTV